MMQDDMFFDLPEQTGDESDFQAIQELLMHQLSRAQQQQQHAAIEAAKVAKNNESTLQFALRELRRLDATLNSLSQRGSELLSSSQATVEHFEALCEPLKRQARVLRESERQAKLQQLLQEASQASDRIETVLASVSKHFGVVLDAAASEKAAVSTDASEIGAIPTGVSEALAKRSSFVLDGDAVVGFCAARAELLRFLKLLRSDAAKFLDSTQLTQMCERLEHLQVRVQAVRDVVRAVTLRALTSIGYPRAPSADESDGFSALEEADGAIDSAFSLLGALYVCDRRAAVHALCHAFRKRFAFHFERKESRLNRLARPEWFFTFVLQCIEAHESFWSTVDQYLSRVHEATRIETSERYSAISQDVRKALVQLCADRSRHLVQQLLTDIETNSENDALLRHLIDEILCFQDAAGATNDAFVGILSDPKLIPQWFRLDRDFLNAQLDVLFQIDKPFHEDESGCTRSLRLFITLFESATARWHCLRNVHYRLAFWHRFARRLLRVYAAELRDTALSVNTLHNNTKDDLTSDQLSDHGSSDHSERGENLSNLQLLVGIAKSAILLRKQLLMRLLDDRDMRKMAIAQRRWHARVDPDAFTTDTEWRRFFDANVAVVDISLDGEEPVDLDDHILLGRNTQSGGVSSHVTVRVTNTSRSCCRRVLAPRRRNTAVACARCCRNTAHGCDMRRSAAAVHATARVAPARRRAAGAATAAAHPRRPGLKAWTPPSTRQGQVGVH
ncbi:MAG: hypothetical protein MHM6MM_005566 [Cercozoa sp. M6MM]